MLFVSTVSVCRPQYGRELVAFIVGSAADSTYYSCRQFVLGGVAGCHMGYPLKLSTDA